MSEDKRSYERERRAAWRAKNPEHVKAYAKQRYEKIEHLRQARIARPCAPDKPATRTCPVCKENKPFDAKHFNIALQNRFKLTNQCRVCMLKRHAINQSKRKYGLTEDQVKEFRNAKHCYICKREAKLQIDHCHTNGHVRGMLCPQCNRALGLFGDNVEALRSAAAYVELHK